MTPSDPSGLYGDSGRPEEGEEQPRVVVRDKRRIDPETGAVREVAPAPSPAAAGTEPRPGQQPTDAKQDQVATDELAERTEDLKRVSAEYANYRRRVDRDRILIGELAQERLVLDLLPVLDDIDRAREHGDLAGAFKSTADQLTSVLDRAGVEAYGEIGDRFDPGIHQAVLHSVSAEITVPTCTYVMRRGYRRGERVLRPAMVGVADPESQAPVPASESVGPSPGGTVASEPSTVDEPTPGEQRAE